MKRTESVAARRKAASRWTKEVAARNRWGFLDFARERSSRPSDTSAGEATGRVSWGGGGWERVRDTPSTSGGRRCGFLRLTKEEKGFCGEARGLPCDSPPAVEGGGGEYGTVHLQQLLVVANDVGRGFPLLLGDDDGEVSLQGGFVIGATRNLGQITERIHVVRFLLDDQLQILFCFIVLQMIFNRLTVHFPKRNRQLPSSNTRTRSIYHACAPME